MALALHNKMSFLIMLLLAGRRLVAFALPGTCIPPSAGMLLAASRCRHPAPRGFITAVSPDFTASACRPLCKLTQLAVICKRTELTRVCLIVVNAASDSCLFLSLTLFFFFFFFDGNVAANAQWEYMALRKKAIWICQCSK